MSEIDESLHPKWRSDGTWGHVSVRGPLYIRGTTASRNGAAAPLVFLTVDGEIGPKLDQYMVDGDFSQLGYSNARIFSCDVKRLNLTNQVTVSVHFLDSGDLLDNGDSFILDGSAAVGPVVAPEPSGKASIVEELAAAVTQIKTEIGIISDEVRAGFAWLEPKLSMYSGGQMLCEDDALVAASFSLLEQCMIENGSREIGAGLGRLSILSSLREVHARLIEATAISTAAVTCASEGAELQAVRLSSDLYHVLREAQMLHCATSILARVSEDRDTAASGVDPSRFAHKIDV